MNDTPKNIVEPDQLWAITESGLQAILDLQSITKVDVSAVMAKKGERPDAFTNYEVRGEVAILPIIGPILRYDGGFLSFFINTTSIEQLAIDFQKAVDDPAIKAIILNVDSPGGTVSGINEFANMVYNARGTKPIVAYVGGMGASAAYWITSAADRIVSNETAELGSIGIVAVVRKSNSEYEFVNTASPKKKIDPSTDAGRAEIIRRVDEVADVFISDIAKFRGVTIETVKTDFGAGSVLIGKSAVKNGLSDELGNFEKLVGELETKINNQRGKLIMSGIEKLTRETLVENFAIIKDQAPDLIKDIETEAHKTGYDAGFEQGKIEGEKIERDRVVAIIKVDDCDLDAQKKAIIEGLNPDAAYKLFFEAERNKRATAVDDIEKSVGTETAGINANDKGDGDDSVEKRAATFTDKVREYQKEKNCTFEVAIKAINKEFPEGRDAYLEIQNRE